MDLIWRLIGRCQGYIKYCMVGAVGFLIHLLVLWFVTDIIHISYIVSASIAIVVAALNNYILNYKWTFKDRKNQIDNKVIGYFKYLLSRGLTEGLYLVLLIVCVDIIGWYYLTSAIAVQFSTAILGYLIAVKWIWRRRTKKRGNPVRVGLTEDA